MRYRIKILICFLLIAVNTAVAADPFNYAELWRSWNIVAREAYISGVIDGIAEAYFVTLESVAPDKFAKNPEPAEVKKTREKLFVRYTHNQIRDVITDLYKGACILASVKVRSTSNPALWPMKRSGIGQSAGRRPLHGSAMGLVGARPRLDNGGVKI